MRCAVRNLLVVAVFAGALACSKKAPEPTKSVATVATTKALPPAAALAEKQVADDHKLNPNDPKHGTRRLMGLDTPVYVDGVQAAVFRFGELPPIASHQLEGGAVVYSMYDYLKGIGVDMAALKSVHFHGNQDRISSVEGTELRAQKDRFQFTFVGGDTGAPVQRWDGSGLKNEFMIHEVRRITVYVKKPSATIDMKKQCHVGADGDCTDAIPYSDGVVAKGTRIYVDGKMVGFVKRRLVTDDMRVGDEAANPEDTKFSVAKLLGGVDVDVNAIKTVEFMAGDDVIGRSNTVASQTTFSLPSHNHGKVKIHVPAEMQAQANGVADKDALVSAVLLYKSTKPASNRDVVAISEDTDLSVQVAAIDARQQNARAE